MASKHFYLAIFIRLIVLIALAITGSYLFFILQDYILTSLTLLLIILVVINLIRFFNKTNRWISYFLMGIENEDASLKAPPKSGNKTINEVYRGMERLNAIFRQTKIDIRIQEQYFRSIINQSATGLFSVNEHGRVINVNPATTKLTRLNEYNHINVLNTVDSALPGFIMDYNLKHQKETAIFENQYGQKLLFKLSDIQTQKETIRLVAVSDITKELDTREVDAWIKLARTLSHEIMNSIAPITTISKVISGYFQKNQQPVEVEQLKPATISNTIKGLNVIEQQGEGLMNFVENYRKFTKLPEPQLKQVNLSELLEKNLLLAGALSNSIEITLAKSIPENSFAQTDDTLLTQVMVNIMKNAIESMVEAETENPELSVQLMQNGTSHRIIISNNGPQIPPEIREQIFVPFYSTKEKGSGIGLSLSKQMMMKMNGDVMLNAAQDGQTAFVVIVN